MSSMPELKRHVLVDGFSKPEDFRSRRLGRNPIIPPQDPTAHGQRLSRQYSELLRQFEERRAPIDNSITIDVGIYVEIVGASGCELPLVSLDTRDFKLRSCRKAGDHEIALVFIPESRRGVFQRKLVEYLDPSKARKGVPRNHNLIDSISEIRLADLRSFWTDAPQLFPTDSQQTVWWELWLKKRLSNEDPLEIARQLAGRINARLG